MKLENQTVLSNTDLINPIKIYISGPMTGYENFNEKAFNDAAERLRYQAYDTVNPADNDHKLGWATCMKIDIKNVVQCDAIVMLPKWEDSKGATTEVAVAHQLGIPIYDLEDFLKLGPNANRVIPLIPEKFATMQPKASGGTKHDRGKLRMDLIPISTLEGLASVLTFGAKKYDDNNWRQGFKWSRVYGALLRHLLAWYSGEDKDPESGLSHIDHVICNAAFLKEFAQTHPELDDRIKQQ